MKIKIEFSTDNAAFEDSPSEIHFVLAQIARKVQSQVARAEGCLCTAAEADDKLLDSNGNTVGSVEIDEVETPIAETAQVLDVLTGTTPVRKAK